VTRASGRPALAALPRRLGLVLAALTLLGALTEGIGLVLLVPMLAALGAGAATGLGGRIGQLAGTIGLPLRLEALLAIFVLLVLARGLIMLARDLAAQRFEARLVDELRRRAWRALLRCEWRTLSGMRQSDTASLLVSNIDRLGDGVNYLIALWMNAATLAALGLAALTIAPGVVVAAAAGGVVVLAAQRGLRRRAHLLGEAIGAAYAAVHETLTSTLGALRIVKSHNREQRAEDDLLAGFGALRRAQRAYVRDTGLARLALQGGGALLLAVLVWLAIGRWQLGAATILPLVALFARALPLLGAVQDSWQNWAHSRPALDAIDSLLLRVEAAREPDLPGALAPSPPPQREIALERVTVRQPDRAAPALDGVSLRLPVGTTTSLTGPSGAGKSTLADVLGGLLTPDLGELRLDGTALDPAARRGWREQVAYVQQEPVLFHASIRDNLRWSAPDADDAALTAALRDAAAGFVIGLPEGLDTVVGDRGGRLSGGERQRIALARGLLRAPSLLILDEATSALDAESESAVAEAIAGLHGRLTILIIGHRGGLAALADRSLRLENGRIVAAEPNEYLDS
jgi:ATP-binding cassette subfamily C protein